MYLRETGLAAAPHREIVCEAKAATGRFRLRKPGQALGWYGLEMLVDSQLTTEAGACPSLVRWLREFVPWTPNRSYIARLDPGGEVFWHADFQDPVVFSDGFFLALRIPQGSFIEFADGTRYVYDEGVGYHIRLGVVHRALNPTAEPRFTAFIGSPGRLRDETGTRPSRARGAAADHQGVGWPSCQNFDTLRAVY